MLKTLIRLLLTSAVAGLLVFAAGCANSNPRVVLVPPMVNTGETVTDLIKIGPDVRGHIYVYTSDGWVLSDNEVQIPEGWVAAPPPPKEN